MVTAVAVLVLLYWRPRSEKLRLNTLVPIAERKLALPLDVSSDNRVLSVTIVRAGA